MIGLDTMRLSRINESRNSRYFIIIFCSHNGRLSYLLITRMIHTRKFSRYYLFSMSDIDPCDDRHRSLDHHRRSRHLDDRSLSFPLLLAYRVTVQVKKSRPSFILTSVVSLDINDTTGERNRRMIVY